MKKLNMDWFSAALIRAIRTMAQTALGMFTVGVAVSEINWMHVLSVSFVSAVYSLLTSISTGLPEAKTDGTLLVDNSGDKLIYRLELNDEVSALGNKTSVTFKVDPNAHLHSPE